MSQECLTIDAKIMATTESAMYWRGLAHGLLLALPLLAFFYRKWTQSAAAAAAGGEDAKPKMLGCVAVL